MSGTASIDASVAHLPTASVADTLALVAEVLAPTIAKGPIIRRPRMVALAERLGLDRRAVRRMQRLAQRYGSAPLMLPIPGAPRAVILAPEHVARVLDLTPDPFATDSSEKREALKHFEPRGALISRGAERADRRRFNDAVLDSGRPMHALAERFVAVVDDEHSRLLQRAGRRGVLDRPEFSEAWFRMVRRVVFGDGAADYAELIEMLARLSRDANWAMLHPVRRRLRRRLLRRIALCRAGGAGEPRGRDGSCSRDPGDRSRGSGAAVALRVRRRCPGRGSGKEPRLRWVLRIRSRRARSALDRQRRTAA